MTTAFDLARSQLGKTEAMVSDYLRTGGQNLNPQELAWCAAFVNSSLQQAGIQGSGSNMARSLLNVGTPTSTPQQGDLAVFWRGSRNGQFGHVGFFDSVQPDGRIRILSGNDGDAVRYGSMPANRLLGYRSLTDLYAPAAGGAGGKLPIMAQAGAPQPTTPGFQMATEPPGRAADLAALFTPNPLQIAAADMTAREQTRQEQEQERRKRLANLFSLT